MLLEFFNFLKAMFFLSVMFLSSNPLFNPSYFFDSGAAAKEIKIIKVDMELFNKIKEEIGMFRNYFDSYYTKQYINLEVIKSFKFKNTNSPILYGRYSFMDDIIVLNVNLINDYYILEATILHELVHRAQIKTMTHYSPLFIAGVGFKDEPISIYIDRCAEISAYYQELKYLEKEFGTNSHKFNYFLEECCIWFLDKLSYNVSTYIGDGKFGVMLKFKELEMKYKLLLK
jgi:hypothetical protein